jgi:hypothetical protein
VVKPVSVAPKAAPAVQGKHVGRGTPSPLSGGARSYTALEFHRNYADAVQRLGGAEVSRSQYTPKLLQGAGGRSAVDKHYFGTCATHSELKISVDGHTDGTGTAARNRELSKQRADTVVSALTLFGIGAARLSAQGFGPDKPLAPETDDASRARNRRVELVKR